MGKDGGANWDRVRNIRVRSDAKNLPGLNKKVAEVSQELRDTKDRLTASDRDKMKDPLTGLSNRRESDILMRNMILHLEHGDNSAKEGVCAVLLDINDFKIVNDKYGHKSGDIILMYMAQLLKENCRSSDIVSRYGGEEFLVVLDEVPMDVVRREFGFQGSDPNRQDGPLIEEVGFVKNLNEILSREIPGLLELDASSFQEDEVFGRLAAGFSFLTAEQYKELNLSPEEAMDKLLVEADAEMYKTKARMKAKVGR